MANHVKIHLVTPDAAVARTGNRCTAQQWADLLSEIGCEVSICGPTDPVSGEILVALHGARSHAAILSFRKENPTGKIIVAMTGTDIYPDPNERVLESMAVADRIVLLQARAVGKIPPEFHSKARVIIQSAEIRASREEMKSESFEVCVVGHFRDVKDPLRAAKAARQMPPDSKVRVSHAGGILDSEYEAMVETEMLENSRYRWLGELDETAVAELMARSDAMVLSSRAEGGARVIGEAIVHGTPVISTRIDAAVGLLGEDYPGFFEVGATRELADLLNRLEQDDEFYRQLKALTESLKPQFAPEREREAWRDLINELG